MAAPHVLVFPFPATSHITCLLELSHRLLERGFKITFLNTEFNQRRLLATMPVEQAAAAATLRMADGIRLAVIPDGLSPDEDRNDIGRLTERMMKVMPGFMEDFLIRNVGSEAADDKERFTCVIADIGMGWALELADKAGLRSVAFFPAAAAVLVGILSIPKLIEDEVIDVEGVPKSNEMFQLSPEMLPMDPTELCWNCFNDTKTSKQTFNYFCMNNRAIPIGELILCNTFHELERSVFSYAPNILPIGPLLIGSRPDKTFGNFWVPETQCIKWLDKQQNNSVIYVAFGSFTVFNTHQFLELALALELTGRPFLWVVRPDLTNLNNKQEVNLSRIVENVGDRGRMVSWCPQPQVLAHPSIACFVSHCGWNSTLEGLRNGVPILCWPYFTDQIFNQTYICDVLRVGLRIADADENNIYSNEQIRSKLEELMSDEKMKERALALKEEACKSLENGGSSFNNFNKFIDTIKMFEC
ncbi:UDP-glycosyltransferase 83A1 [Platanthera guangdongensis]|uniref:Glycosyltransferase n=1 Tax=Platanthera guangdongensis TaxID=2320717 RepID=A0ABR2LDC7_9ASPA